MPLHIPVSPHHPGCWAVPGTALTGMWLSSCQDTEQLGLSPGHQQRAQVCGTPTQAFLTVWHKGIQSKPLSFHASGCQVVLGKRLIS